MQGGDIVEQGIEGAGGGVGRALHGGAGRLQAQFDQLGHGLVQAGREQPQPIEQLAL